MPSSLLLDRDVALAVLTHDLSRQADQTLDESGAAISGMAIDRGGSRCGEHNDLSALRCLEVVFRLSGRLSTRISHPRIRLPLAPVVARLRGHSGTLPQAS